MIYTVSCFVCLWVARLVFGLRVEGLEHVPLAGPVILAPNHVSYLDPVLVGVSVPRRVHFMAKKELFRNPLMGWLLRNLQVYPVVRERVDPSTLKHTLSLLAAGRMLLIFPEGTRGDGRTLGPAKAGIAVIAARSGAPVVPVFHWGAERILPREGRPLRWARLRVRFGPPLVVPPGTSGRDGLEAFGRELMEALAALRPSGGASSSGIHRAASPPGRRPPASPV